MAKRGRKKAKDDKGYLESNKENHTPYKIITGNKITMKGVRGNIYAIPVDKSGNAGKGRLMKPDEEHEFEGASQIIEVPEKIMAQRGVNTGDINPQYQGFGKPILDFIQSAGTGIGNRISENLQKDRDMISGWFGTDEVANPNDTGAGDYDVSRFPEQPWDMTQGAYDVNMPNMNPPNLVDADAVNNRPPYLTDEQMQERADRPVPQMGEVTQTPTPQMGEVVETPTPTLGKITSEFVEDEDEDETVTPTEVTKFANPYAGVDIPTAAQTLGSSLSYQGDRKGANTVRGVASGLKLLSGLGRNIMSGYAQNKRNQFTEDAYNKEQKRGLKKTTSRQQGGNIKREDLPFLNEVAFMKKGGDTSKLLTGAFMTGNPNQPSNVETEKGEHIKDNTTGRVAEVIGKKHSQGGEMMDLEDHKVLSDFNKIGGDKAKRYRDEYDINVKAKDTFATVMDKVMRKIGYNSKIEEMEEYITKVEKEKERNKDEKEMTPTAGINLDFLSGKINKVNEELQPLEETKSRVFDTLFQDQQGDKSPAELAEENGVAEAATGRDMSESLNRPKNISDDQWAIAKKIYDAAVELGDKYPELTVAQAALETGWFKKESGKNNYFGQKGTTSQDTSEVTTHEYEDGKKVKTKAGFRNYDSIKDAVADRMRLWGSRYKDAESLDEAVDIITGGDGKPAYATDPKYADKISSIVSTLGVEGGLPDVPKNLQETGDAPRRSAEDFPEVNTTEKGDFTGDVNDPDFQRWFYQVYGGQDPKGNIPSSNLERGQVDLGQVDISVDPITGEEIQREAQQRTPASSETPQGGGQQSEGTRDKTLLIPNQLGMPPSGQQPHRLSEVTPRQSEAVLVSPDAQIAEINRQFQAAKESINQLPDSQRRAALAQLTTSTQSSINQVMSQTNAANVEVQNRVNETNAARQANADIANENAANLYEESTFIAKDKTEQEMRNFFNAAQKQQVANFNLVNQLNMMNEAYSNVDFTGGSGFKTQGAPTAEEFERMKNYYLATGQNTTDTKEQKAKRGRKTKK